MFRFTPPRPFTQAPTPPNHTDDARTTVITMVDSMWRPSRRLLPVVLLLALLLLVGVAGGTQASVGGRPPCSLTYKYSSNQPTNQPRHTAAAAAGASGGMTREQHMQAKRAFDRAKHHPSVSGDPEVGLT